MGSQGPEAETVSFLHEQFFKILFYLLVRHALRNIANSELLFFIAIEIEIKVMAFVLH